MTRSRPPAQPAEPAEPLHRIDFARARLIFSLAWLPSWILSSSILEGHPLHVEPWMWTAQPQMLICPSSFLVAAQAVAIPVSEGLFVIFTSSLARRTHSVSALWCVSVAAGAMAAGLVLAGLLGALADAMAAEYYPEDRSVFAVWTAAALPFSVTLLSGLAVLLYPWSLELHPEHWRRAPGVGMVRLGTALILVTLLALAHYFLSAGPLERTIEGAGRNSSVFLVLLLAGLWSCARGHSLLQRLGR
jgi:hypothetical protein